MTHKSKPAPTTSAKMKARKPVAHHDGKPSVGHSLGAKRGPKGQLKCGG